MRPQVSGTSGECSQVTGRVVTEPGLQADSAAQLRVSASWSGAGRVLNPARPTSVDHTATSQRWRAVQEAAATRRLILKPCLIVVQYMPRRIAVRSLEEPWTPSLAEDLSAPFGRMAQDRGVVF